MPTQWITPNNAYRTMQTNKTTKPIGIYGYTLTRVEGANQSLIVYIPCKPLI